MRKQINIGGLSFADICEKDNYYVDKSLLIKDILDSDRRGVYLFTRPRRFGKTTNLSMLDAFFNMNYKGNAWFDDLEISKYPEYERYKNAFPVIYLDLKETESSTYEEFVDCIRSTLYKAFDAHRYIKGSNIIEPEQVEVFQNVIDRSTKESYLRDCIPLLCKLLERYHGVKPIILIDEYDRAVSDAFGSESHEPMMKLLGRILGAALKSNEHLQMAVVTGVMQIAKESIFSGLNNLRVNNIFSKMSDERYGFTEAEVKQVLSDYGHPEKFDEAKEWYDGYHFGNAEVYNPYSIMNYITEDFEAESYWAGTSSNTMIYDLLGSMDADMYSKFVTLSNGGTITAEMVPGVPYSDLTANNGSLIFLMVMSGYLTAKRSAIQDDYIISIPNKEMLKVFGAMFRSHSRNAGERIKRLWVAVISGESDKVKDITRDLLKSVDPKIMDHEHSYQAFMLALMFTLEGSYEITSEGLGGDGYYDIRMRSMVRDVPHIVIEMKRRKKDDPSIETLSENALQQIRDKDYTHMLKGEVLVYGMAFEDRKVAVASDIIVL